MSKPKPTPLYARLKRSSKYHYQATSSMPFPVTIGNGPSEDYIVYGNGNQYRLRDVTFFVHVGDRFVSLIPSRPRQSHAADSE